MLPVRPLIEAAANLLTIGAVDPTAKIPEDKECAVKVVKT